MNTFKIYHVSRHLAKHNYELDDRIYGSPLQKDEVDWPLKNPRLYLQRLKSELSLVEVALDDLAFLMRENGCPCEIPNPPKFTQEEADAYAYHKFHIRQFEYVEKLRYQLQEHSPAEIDIIIPKAKRQLNILLAARSDLIATIVRFSAYADEMQ